MANAVYVTKLNALEREAVFSNVVDFFNETWKETPKPFKFNQRIVKKKQLTSDEAAASRETTSQAISFVCEDGAIRYNKRKIKELPGFIGQMTSNISIPLACKHIYFNYEFLHGMFLFSFAHEIFEDIKKFTGGSSFFLSDEASIAMKELQLLDFFFFQCIMSMCDYADSLATQIESRLLMFNGSIPLLTELFKQADENSKYHCALISAYQSLPPPGIGPLFILEKHSKPIYCTLHGFSLIFTLSTKVHVFNITGILNLGEIELPKLKEPYYYKQMIVTIQEDADQNFHNLKLMKGMIVVISSHILYSTNFDSTSIITKTFEHVKIHSILLVSPKHVLVLFEQEKYFEIYDFYSGELVFVQNFELKIKLIPLGNSDLIHILT